MSDQRKRGGAKRRGRPASARNFATIVREIAQEEVVVRDAAGAHRTTILEAVLKKLQLAAMKGNLVADRFLDEVLLRNAPPDRSEGGLLVVSEVLSSEEWIRRQNILNDFRKQPEELTPTPKPLPISPAPPRRRAQPAAGPVTVVPQFPPRLIR